MIDEKIFEDSRFPYRRICAAVDLDALAHNLELLRSILPEGVKLCAVVKADAYGHGVVGTLATLERYADCYAVAALEEGIRIRQMGTKKPVLILGALLPGEYETMLAWDLTAAVSSLREGKLLSEAAYQTGRTGHMHIAVDTGMSRIGFRTDEAGFSEVLRLRELPGLSIDGCFTHFATADEPGKEQKTEEQLQAFQAFLKRLSEAGIDPGLCHCANSAAILTGVGTGFSMVRGGIAMYGLYPSRELEGRLPLRPVMQLKSWLTSIRQIQAGETVGYGAVYCAKGPVRVGTVSAGYADGYPRSAGCTDPEGKGMDVLVRGKRCPILGRICMDQLMVDLSGLPEAKEGDPVTLFGRDGAEEIGLRELAERSGGFHYELMCAVSGRVPRAYFRNGRFLSGSFTE